MQISQIGRVRLLCPPGLDNDHRKNPFLHARFFSRSATVTCGYEEAVPTIRINDVSIASFDGVNHVGAIHTKRLL
jgi:hypothetical protein